MKRFVAMFMIMFMALSLAACSKETSKPTSTATATPTEMPEPTMGVMGSVQYDDDIKVTFANEAITVNIDKFLLDAAVGEMYTAGYDGTGSDEKVELTSILLEIYDIKNAEKGILKRLKFPVTYDLRSTENIIASIDMKPTHPYTEIEYFTFETLKDIESHGLEEYGLRVTGYFNRINGDEKMIDAFSFETEMTIVNKIKIDELPHATVLFTETGAQISIKENSFLKALGKEGSFNAKAETAGLFLSFDDFVYRDFFSQEIIFDSTDRTYNFNIKYDDTIESNKTMYYAIEDGFIYATVSIADNDINNEYITAYFIVEDATANYEIPEREYVFDEANPYLPTPTPKATPTSTANINIGGNV